MRIHRYKNMHAVFLRRANPAGPVRFQVVFLSPSPSKQIVGQLINRQITPIAEVKCMNSEWLLKTDPCHFLIRVTGVVCELILTATLIRHTARVC